MPYIFFVKKGSPNTVVEELGTEYDKFIYLKVDLQNNTTNGLISTKQIGPASRWDSINWRSYSPKDPTGDEVFLNYFASKEIGYQGSKIDVFDEKVQTKFQHGFKMCGIP